MGLQRKSDELFQSIPEVRYSPPLSPHSSLSSASQSSRRSFGFSPASSSSTPDTYYLRSSEEGEGGSSEEVSDSQVYTQRETHQQRSKPRLPGIATYVPHDLPKSFELPNNFGKKVNKSLSECKAYGSMPQDVIKTFLRQVTEHMEAENPHPCVKTIEWVAWKYCSLYPGLKQANPVESLQKPDEWNGASSTFKEWVCEIVIDMADVTSLNTFECFHNDSNMFYIYIYIFFFTLNENIFCEIIKQC